eukprot:TRINITY_DN3701_c0_g1_i12.p1 TRINITY_DN3701_c0_g1~~TRINITY_DN3701_c0_g1_i12.p1  ORF type:complete len:191 (-),score=22.54 TRINITY_DN3701_c0_g1_i12:622-1194(-)
MVLNKPSGLPVLRSEMFYQHTVMAYLEHLHPPPKHNSSLPNPNPSVAAPVHRLGVGTSGVLLCAKTKLARAGLSAALQHRKMSKYYLALVSIPPGSQPLEDRFSVDHPIGQVEYCPGLSIAAVCTHGKKSLSHAEVLHRGSAAAIVRVNIPTGRPHQIRIHMAAHGFPLVGDPLYGVGGVPRQDILYDQV